MKSVKKIRFRLPVDGHYAFWMAACLDDGNYYVRPCDIAAAMNGSSCEFNVMHENGELCIIKNTPYEFRGGELSPATQAETDVEAESVSLPVRCGEASAKWNGLRADGEYYVEFSQLAELIGFRSHCGFRGWSAATWTDQHVVVPGIVKFGDFSCVKPTPFGAVKCFDDFWFVGDGSVGCFVMQYLNDKGEKKLCMIDALSWQWEFDQIMVPEFRRLGLRLEDVTDILITHEHFDHWGISKHMQETYGTRIHWTIEGERDAHASWKYWNENGLNDDGRLLEPPKCDVPYSDGETLHFGAFDILCVHTPGHSNYCYSFVVNVTDHGETHVWCCWGGTGMPAPKFGGPSPMLSDRVPDQQARYRRMVSDYAASAQRFRKICAEMHVDCEISNHPYCDYSGELLPYVEKARESGPNPLIRGEDFVQIFLYGVYAEAKLTLSKI